MRLEPQQRVTVAQEVSAGASVADTSRKWGIHPETVRVICAEEGIRLVGSKASARFLAQLADEVAGGASVAAVAAAHRVSPVTVHRACRENAVRVPRSHHVPEVRARAVALVKELGSLEAAARRLELDPSVISRWCRKEGVDLDRRNARARHAQSKEGEIVALVQRGHSEREITDATGVSSFAIAKYAKRHELTRSPGRKKPIEVRALTELDSRAAEIMSLAELTPRTRRYRDRDVAQFLNWCEESTRDSFQPQALADYIRHLAEKGTSGRPQTWGRPVGSTFGAIQLKARAVIKWHAGMGRRDARQWPAVKSALAWAQTHAPKGDGQRRRLTDADLQALASAPPPPPTRSALRARLVLFGVAQQPDAELDALSRSLCALSANDCALSDADATLTLPVLHSGALPASLVFAHTTGGIIDCGHCLVRYLLEQTSPGASLCGYRYPAQGAVQARRTIAAAMGRVGLTSLDGDGLQRLRWHVEPALVRWCRSQASAALLRSTGVRGAEARQLDIADIDLLEGRYWTLLVRSRKNDQAGDGLVYRIDAEYAPGTALCISLWLAVRGPAPGALFSLGGAPLSYSSTRADLRLLAQHGGVELDRFGGHSFRRTAISDLLDREVFIRRVAGRIGIAPQTVLGYHEELTGTPTTELLGLGS